MIQSQPNAAEQAPHLPVMLAETLEHLNLKKHHWYLDGTFGAGGHSKALLEQGVNVLGIDQDTSTSKYMNAIKSSLGSDQDRFKTAHGNFEDLASIVKNQGLENVSGILLDLGVSSMQIDEAERGFAFRKEGPLDMRMHSGPDSTQESAADVVNHLAQEDLAALIFKYGEERYSRRIARVICEAREENTIESTQDLVAIIQRAYPKGKRKDHPARRTFQALRIYVNDELGVLERALEASEQVLAETGRLVIMSYHSLEDRIVKHFFRNSSTLDVITKRPLVASEEECEQNPRARSAKLRVAERNTVKVVQ